MEANKCMLCGDIWNAVNLVKRDVKDKELLLCPDCSEKFDSVYMDISKVKKIKEDILNEILEEYDENTEDHPAYDTYDAHHGGIKFCLDIINKNFKLKE